MVTIETLGRKPAPTVWATGSSDSFYLGNTGPKIAWWPGSAADYHRRTRKAEPADYHIRWPQPDTRTRQDRAVEPSTI